MGRLVTAIDVRAVESKATTTRRLLEFGAVCLTAVAGAVGWYWRRNPPTEPAA